MNSYHASLWERGLHSAFPAYDGRRGDLRLRLERLRLVRNRAAHHEPIFARDLLVDHSFLCDVAGFIDPDLRELVATHSRLPHVVQNRAATEAGLRATRF